MNINWNIVIPLCTLAGGLIYKTLSYHQENKKLKIELEKYNDEKGPTVKKELGIPKEKYNEYIDFIMDDYLLSDKNKRIIFNITAKIDKHFDISSSEKSFTNETSILYDEARVIYTSFKKAALPDN